MVRDFIADPLEFLPHLRQREMDEICRIGFVNSQVVAKPRGCLNDGEEYDENEGRPEGEPGMQQIGHGDTQNKTGITDTRLFRFNHEHAYFLSASPGFSSTDCRTFGDGNCAGGIACRGCGVPLGLLTSLIPLRTTVIALLSCCSRRARVSST
jgi:hypothetical protein